MLASAGTGASTRPRLGWRCRGRTARRGRSSAAVGCGPSSMPAWPDGVTEVLGFFFTIFTITQSSKYNSYNDVYNFSVFILELFHFYHIYLCATARRPHMYARSAQVTKCPLPSSMREMSSTSDLLLSSPSLAPQLLSLAVGPQSPAASPTRLSPAPAQLATQ